MTPEFWGLSTWKEKLTINLHKEYSRDIRFRQEDRSLFECHGLDPTDIAVEGLGHCDYLTEQQENHKQSRRKTQTMNLEASDKAEIVRLYNIW